MTKRILYAATVTLVVAVLALGASDKKREWQEGKLLDVSNDGYTITYAMESAEYVYVASHIHHLRWDKNIPVTINGKIKFAVEKSKVYIVDDEGREHELKFVKRYLKEDKK